MFLLVIYIFFDGGLFFYDCSFLVQYISISNTFVENENEQARTAHRRMIETGNNKT